MQNQFINFLSDNVKINEYREYSKYFDEAIHAYNESCKKHFIFWLSFDYSTNTGNIEIPNCGDMVDEFPKSQLQLDWTISELNTLSVNKVWQTKWTFLNKEAYATFITILETSDTRLNQISYSADVAELNLILLHIYKSNLSVSKIIIINDSKVDGFDINSLTNNHLNELANNHIYSKYRFIEILNEILNTEKITIDSKIHVYINSEL